MHDILARPRSLALFCGAGAVALGLAYMLAAGAPTRYLVVNLVALILGATAWLALDRTVAWRIASEGWAVVALSVPLLLTALFGMAVDGASRWVALGPLNIQVSLVFLPVAVVLYARRPTPVATAGIALASVALAAQPDRGMAGALAAGMLAVTLVKPSRVAGLALATAALALSWTLFTPDTLPATPYVDLVFYTAFSAHPLAGPAVVAGTALLLAPALTGARLALDERAALLAFSACWAGIVAAAALGHYPTPLVGYGGSAILGYLLSAAMLPGGARGTSRQGAPGSRPLTAGKLDQETAELRTAGLT